MGGEKGSAPELRADRAENHMLPGGAEGPPYAGLHSSLASGPVDV